MEASPVKPAGWTFFAGLFLFCLAYFGFLSAVPAFTDPDAFYHAKMAQLIAQTGGPVREFPWLSMTAFADPFVDHQFLYHVLLVPFVMLFPPLIGIKIATVLFASLFIVFFTWLTFRGFQVSSFRFHALFLLLLLTNAGFIFRLNLAKTSAVSLLFFFGAIWCILYRRTIVLGILSFFYVLLYGGWPLVLAAAGMAWIAQIATRHCEPQAKQSIQQCVFTGFLRRLRLLAITAITAGVPHILLGVVAGLVFNPYFPANLQFYAMQSFSFPFSLERLPVGVGAEWYGSGISFVPSNALLLLLVLAAIGAMVRKVRGKRLEVIGFESVFLCMLTIVFALLAFKSNRHIEYFAPIAFLFVGRVLAPAVAELPILSERLSLLSNRLLHRSFWFHFVATYLLVAFGFIIFIGSGSLVQVHRSTQFFEFNTFAGAAQWLSGNSLSSSRVWHDRWDDFPLLFFTNSHNTYISGLDPRFLCKKSERLCREYEQIHDGTAKRGIARMIKNDFGAAIAVVRSNNTPLIEKLKKEKARETYADPFVKIFLL